MDARKLAAEFPRECVHWRVQGTPIKRGEVYSAMALAYIDARDVMDRLDDVCGPDNWQDEYVETAKGRIICRLGIRLDGGWVWKSDGAGETAVEGEKGGISDALKRAAVKWGIGRYLYRLDSPWLRCEAKEDKGKIYWKRWTEDPWSKVRSGGYVSTLLDANEEKPAPDPLDEMDTFRKSCGAAILNIRSKETVADLREYWMGLEQNMPAVAKDAAVIKAKDERREAILSKKAAA